MNFQQFLLNMGLLMILICIIPTLSERHLLQEKYYHHISLERFRENGCKGEYDSAEFSRLNRVCTDCYNLYKDTDIHTGCLANCFVNTMFEDCVDALLIDREREKIKEKVKRAVGELKE